jgi:anti-sigma-K factor RskA
MDEKHYEEWLPAYALNILSAEETALVAEHLAGCPICRADLQRYQAVADDLSLAATQAAPRPIVKTKLMKQIHARQVKADPAPRLSYWQVWKASLRRSLLLWGAALLVVLALGNVFLLRRLDQARQEAVAPMRVVALASTQDSPQAVGTLIMDEEGEYGTLVVDNLAVLDAEHKYQIWLNQDGQRTSGGLFSVNAHGYASLEILAPQPLIEYQAIGITIEPAAGSPGPTGAKVLGGDITP